jgi:hypothetical protein
MAFKNSTGAAVSVPVAGSAKPIGGRYAGIRPPTAGVEMAKAGEYVFEGVDTKGSRKGATALIQAKVIQSTGDGCTPVSDKTVRLMINFGGNAFDVGSARLVALAMALCNCETVEQLAAEEPHYDELIDLLCGARVQSEHYGENPIAGRKFWARGWYSEALSKKGDPFVNWEFGIAAE